MQEQLTFGDRAAVYQNDPCPSSDKRSYKADPAPTGGRGLAGCGFPNSTPFYYSLFPLMHMQNLGFALVRA